MNLLFAFLSISLMILLPVGLAVWLRRQITVPWWLFCVGIVTFAASQIYHIPLNNWLTDLGVIGAVAADAPDLLKTAIILGLSAGLSESIARAIAFGLLFWRQQAQKWHDSLLVGLGHGGIEAMFFGGVMTAVGLTTIWSLRGVDLNTLGLAADQLETLATQIALLDSSPGLLFVPLLERFIALTMHVAISTWVWQAFARRNPLWFVLAVAYHSFFDGTAVYAAQFIDNIWLLEGILALMAVPGLVWLIYAWRKQATDRPSRQLMPLVVEWRLLGTAVVHELRTQWRTRRVLVVLAVFVLMGLGSPLLAQFTPEILRNVEGAEQFADLIPEPSTADALSQYLQNITQFGFLLAILLGMGAVAAEKERGTAAMILTKPLPRWAFVMSKFIAQTAVYLAGFAAASLGAYYYTSILFVPLELGPFLLGNLLLWLWLLTYAAVTLLASVATRGTGAAAGVALIGAILLLVAGSLPQIGALAPSGLVAWASQLGLPETIVAANGGAVAMGGAIIVVCLITAVALFETQEL